MSIRTRLAIAVALVLLMTFALVGFALVRSTRATLTDQVDQQVRVNADRNMTGKGPSWDDGEKGDHGPQGYDDLTPAATSSSAPDPYERTVGVFVFGPDGRQLLDEPCGFTDDPKPRPQIPDIPSDHIDLLVNRIVTTPAVDNSISYRMFVQRSDGGQYVITAASLDDVDSAVAKLVRTFFLVGAIALAAATLAALWMISRGLRPVDRMVDTAAAIAAGDLSRRVPNADPRTELGRLGTALNEMMVQIEAAVKARTASEQRLRRFVGDAAHELRTPLTSLRGYAELYRQGAIPDAAGVANAMGRIESEGARMAHLVDDMLLLARLDQQRGLETAPVDLVELTSEAIADFRVVAPDRPISESLPAKAIIQGDKIRIRQIIDNLLTNARIHTPPGTPVEVTIADAGSSIELIVRDEGPGISKDDQERIFERFWRADPARVRSRGGTGLGLAIVASLVEAHGGAIAVTSEPGKGTAFRVTLPKQRLRG